MRADAGHRVLLAIVAALLLVIAAMGYRFIVTGSVERAEDGRIVIALEPAERAFVLGEMRGFVAGLQRLTDAIARDDMKAVSVAARGLGMAGTHDAPLPIMGKLPLAFKALGLSLHRDFDLIAMDAERLGNPKHTLAQLAGAIQKCVACHETYQFKTAVGP